MLLNKYTFKLLFITYQNVSFLTKEIQKKNIIFIFFIILNNFIHCDICPLYPLRYMFLFFDSKKKNNSIRRKKHIEIYQCNEKKKLDEQVSI